MSTARTHALLLLLRVAPDPVTVTDPVELADRRTSLADARAALCLAHGIHPDDITGLGYDHTRAAYESVRASWVQHIEQDGWADRSYLKLSSDIAEVMRDWADFLGGDNWLSEGWERHLAAYPRGCGRLQRGGQCDLCQPVTRLPQGYYPPGTNPGPVAADLK